MIADPEGPSFITRTVGRRRYADDASVSHGTHSPFATLQRSGLIFGDLLPCRQRRRHDEPFVLSIRMSAFDRIAIGAVRDRGTRN